MRITPTWAKLIKGEPLLHNFKLSTRSYIYLGSVLLRHFLRKLSCLWEIAPSVSPFEVSDAHNRAQRGQELRAVNCNDAIVQDELSIPKHAQLSSQREEKWLCIVCPFGKESLPIAIPANPYKKTFQCIII